MDKLQILIAAGLVPFRCHQPLLMVDEVLAATVNVGVCALSCSPLSQDGPHSAALGLWLWALTGSAKPWKDESIQSLWMPGGHYARVGYPESSRWPGRRMLMCT